MSEEAKRYGVRWYERARRDLDRAVVDYAEYTGNRPLAAQMYTSIQDLAASLGENPDRNMVAETESVSFGFPVRRVLYRLSRNSRVAYHLIYYTVEDGEDGEDDDLVSIVHVRYASRAALTREEAREIMMQR